MKGKIVLLRSLGFLLLNLIPTLGLRAETLTIDEWGALAKAVQA